MKRTNLNAAHHYLNDMEQALYKAKEATKAAIIELQGGEDGIIKFTDETGFPMCDNKKILAVRVKNNVLQFFTATMLADVIDDGTKNQRLWFEPNYVGSYNDSDLLETLESYIDIVLKK